MELKKYRLGDIAEIIGGVSYSPKDICTGGIRILRGGNIQNQHIELKTDDVFLPISYKNNISQIYVGDTILVASTGSVDVLGKAATCFQYTEDVQIGAFLRIIRPKADKYTMLISSALSSDYFKRYIKAQAKGTSINNITLGYLRDFEIYAPHDFTGLSHLSANIENKICLNRAINDNLEAMAKQLYDYWFVQFDFPNEDGKPYKSSGGAMVWNEKLKREIPKGWSGVSLKDLALTSRNAITPVENEVYQHFSIPSFDAYGSYSLDNGSDIKSDKFVLQEGQLLVSKLNPWFNRVVWVPKGTNMIGSTEFVVLNPNNESESGYIYSVIKSPKFIAYCSQAATGTSHSQRRVSPDILMAFKVVYEQGVVQKYGCLIEKIQKQQAELLSEIAMLTKQRDELLPLLMNGQASINSD